MQSMNKSWSNIEWHYEVHRRLGEELVFFLVQVRPFVSQNIIETLEDILEKKQLESVRVFEVFGPNDLLIRAWLHSSVKSDFQSHLQDALGFIQEIRDFDVTAASVISSSVPSIDNISSPDLLDKLYDVDNIRALQQGKDDALLKELIDSGIAFPRPQSPDPIKFFLTIKLTETRQKLKEAFVKELYEYITEADSIQNVSIYQGSGFCDVLLKAETKSSFFAIGELINWIWASLAHYGVSTETYIVALPYPLVETPDKISEATFKAISGKDTLVQWIVPELYDSHYTKRKIYEEVITNADKKVVTEYRKLVHDYLLGCLNEKNAEVKRVLFDVFNELEEYLRENHKVFIGKNNMDPRKVYNHVGVNENSGHISLGNLFNIYGHVIKENQLNPSDTDLTGNWNDLASLRNKPAHGDFDYRTEWKSALNVLLKDLPRLAALIKLIQRTTGKNYSFEYLANGG